MADGSSIVKAGGGMVVQVVRSGGSAPLGGNTISVVDMPTSAQRSYVIPSQQQQPNTEGNTPAKRMTMQGRTLSMTPMHPRFTATNRLGTPQTVPAPSYGIKRPFTSDYGYEYSAIRKFPRSADKSKGLRHFSTKVCEKVKEKGHTNYNEVADELVQEYFDSLSNPPCDQEKQQYDMKNIRRRVYDALNVLMAMNIIVKEKKEISWVGLPTSSIQECRRLEEEKSKRLDRIKQKAEQLQELIIQLVAYKSLVERNREKERNDGRPPENTVLYLPYIVVNTDKKTTVDCHISDDKTEYLFNFDQPFEIHDDIEVLKRLGLAHGLERAEVTAEQRPKVKGYLPPALRDYVDQILEGTLCGGLIGPSVKPAPPVTVINPISIDRKPISLYGSPMIRMPMSTGGTSGIITSGNRSFSRPLHEYASRPANIQTSTMRYTVLPRGAQQIGQQQQQQQQRYASGTTTFRSVGGTGGRQYLVQPTSTGRPMTYVQQRTQPITYNIQAPQSHHHHQQQQQQHHFIEAEQIYDEDDENMVDFE